MFRWLLLRVFKFMIFFFYLFRPISVIQEGKDEANSNIRHVIPLSEVLTCNLLCNKCKLNSDHCCNWCLLTRPSAPIRPRPDTLKVTSASQWSKLTLFLVHTEPLWLRSEGVMRTWSALGMASGVEKKVWRLVGDSCFLCENTTYSCVTWKWVSTLGISINAVFFIWRSIIHFLGSLTSIQTPLEWTCLINYPKNSRKQHV